MKLDKSSSHTIRIEKEGYRPAEIRLKSRLSWGLVLNLLWSIPCLYGAVVYGFDAQSHASWKISRAFQIGIFAVPPATALIDACSIRSRRFDSHIIIDLEENQGNAQPAVLEVDAEEFQKVVRISVLCEAEESEKK